MENLEKAMKTHDNQICTWPPRHPKSEINERPVLFLKQKKNIVLDFKIELFFIKNNIFYRIKKFSY